MYPFESAINSDSSNLFKQISNNIQGDVDDVEDEEYDRAQILSKKLQKDNIAKGSHSSVSKNCTKLKLM